MHFQVTPPINERLVKLPPMPFPDRTRGLALLRWSERANAPLWLIITQPDAESTTSAVASAYGLVCPLKIEAIEDWPSVRAEFWPVVEAHLGSHAFKAWAQAASLSETAIREAAEWQLDCILPVILADFATSARDVAFAESLISAIAAESGKALPPFARHSIPPALRPIWPSAEVWGDFDICGLCRPQRMTAEMPAATEGLAIELEWRAMGKDAPAPLPIERYEQVCGRVGEVERLELVRLYLVALRAAKGGAAYAACTATFVRHRLSPWPKGGGIDISSLPFAPRK